jgi:hypothetical protein
MTIQAGNNTYLNGDISLTGLPDINKTFIDFKQTVFVQLIVMLPLSSQASGKLPCLICKAFLT